jgi:hypothetical protein
MTTSRSWNAGAANPQAKLTEEQVRAIRADQRFQKVIAGVYGVTQVTISHIKARRIWGQVQ